MISVDVPKNLDEVKTKAVGNFTKRQVIFFGIGGVLAVLAYFGTKGVLGTQAAAIIAMLFAAPAFLFAQYEKNGFTGEQVALLIINKKVLQKEVRPYQSENIYFDLEIEEKLRKEKAEIERQLYGTEKSGGVPAKKAKKSGAAKRK
ncbi:MAG: PrgI family protein [Butyrivibrio sp.]|nr:PrgI family protein [Butyrivibrio sp.]